MPMPRSFLRMAALGVLSVGAVASLTPDSFAREKTDRLTTTDSVTGQVVDDRGRPVPGTRVYLMVTLKSDSDPVGHAISDAQGRFAFPIKREQRALDHHEQTAAVWAYAPGHAVTSGRAYMAVWGDDPPPITLRLGPTADTSFVVLDPEGRPVAGARVDPYYLKTFIGSTFPPKPLLPALGATTDAHGRARLPGLGRQDLQSVSVETRAYGRQVFGLSGKLVDQAERTIRLENVGGVIGQVLVDPPWRARGLEVSLSTTGAPAAGIQIFGQARVVTDDRGRF